MVATHLGMDGWTHGGGAMTTIMDADPYGIWKEQAEFNRLLRVDPTTLDARTAVTKELVLNMMAQCVQLLECTGWRAHRNMAVQENAAQTRSQLADIMKVSISLAQTWGESWDTMARAFWQKSAVCRQRHAEEWVRDLHRPAVVLDLDNVLCDYIRGFVEWMTLTGVLKGEDQIRRANALIGTGAWVEAKSLGMSESQFERMKHQFRSSGWKANLPPMPGAAQFVQWCRQMGWQVIVITSRPIDVYPNLYTDTVLWLDTHGIVADFIWWGTDKARKIVDRNVAQHIVFVVDDDMRFCRQYVSLGMPIFWLLSTRDVDGATGQPQEGVFAIKDTPHLFAARSLSDIETFVKENASWLIS